MEVETIYLSIQDKFDRSSGFREQRPRHDVAEFEELPAVVLVLPRDDVEEGKHRIKSFFTIMNCYVSKKSGRLLDLGAGPCVFAKRARDLGYQVTAVDGRTDRRPSPEELGSIRFVVSDIRNFDVRGYDIVLILGLLYHLDVIDQENLLKRCAYGAYVLVDTQIHDTRFIRSEPELWETELVEIEGQSRYTGVLYPEKTNPMASIGNRQSFWHTESSLLCLFECAGFKSVLIFDPAYVSKYLARKFYLLQS